MIWKQNFQFLSNFPPKEVLSAISQLLQKRYVNHVVTDNMIVSTEIPIPMLSFDRRLYSRDNFVGLNPFIYINKIVVSVEPHIHDQSRIRVTVISIRPFIPLAFMCFLAFVCWHMTSDPLPGVIVLLITILSYIFAFHVIVARALPSEIRKALVL